MTPANHAPEVGVPMRISSSTLALIWLCACHAGGGGDAAGDAATTSAANDVLPETPRFARLTHVQWELTVQDLLFLPGPTGLSETFIGDPLSEGFENDAEGLQVSPELWQDYQRGAETLAAEVVSDAALYAQVVPQDPRTGSGGVAFDETIEAEDAANQATTGQAEGNNYDLWSAGDLTATFELPAAGSYTVRTRAWADQGGPDLAQLSLAVDGVVLLTTDVSAASSASGEEFEAVTTLTGGAHRVTVSFLNDYYQDGVDRNLHVDWFAVEGGGSALGASTAGDTERDAWLRAFGKRAFRRPLTDAEVASYQGLFDGAPDLYDTDDDFADGVQLVITAMLQSPYFLYRTEESTARAVDGSIPLSDWELASKLSYGLWNTMPDDALFAAAADGTLATDAGLRAQAGRLFDDPRAHAMVADLHRQLLNLDNYANISKDPALYPEFTATTSASMVAEAQAYVEDGVFGAGGVRGLMTSSRTFVNQDLAAIYGITGIQGDALVPVDLDPTQRAGLLTLSGFLAFEGDAYVHSPIKRGVFANLEILCANLPPPPGMVPPLPPSDGTMTTRERVEEHTGDGTCGEGCHSTMINPIGFAYEHYDALGRWRTEEYGLPVDSSASYAFSGGEQSYADAVELASILADQPQVHECYVGHLMEYLEGRHRVPDDDAAIARLGAASRDQNQPIRDLVLGVVTSPSFRFRSAEVQ